MVLTDEELAKFEASSPLSVYAKAQSDVVFLGNGTTDGTHLRDPLSIGNRSREQDDHDRAIWDQIRQELHDQDSAEQNDHDRAMWDQIGQALHDQDSAEHDRASRSRSRSRSPSAVEQYDDALHEAWVAGRRAAGERHLKLVEEVQQRYARGSCFWLVLEELRQKVLDSA